METTTVTTNAVVFAVFKVTDEWADAEFAGVCRTEAEATVAVALIEEKVGPAKGYAFYSEYVFGQIDLS